MVEVQDRQRTVRVRARRFERLLARLARRYRREGAEVVLVFVGERAIRRLNRDFRKKDKVTDVLSFPEAWSGETGGRKRGRRLGDIVVCVPRARRQAAELGHPLEAELAYLALHGYLHLLGYDHGRGHEEEERRAVRSLRREGILAFPP
ncbi:MAG: rRNA maturation RNase YbeY [Candidatus Aminicenantes bacterium]|nr:rRNA maturation RNase YbeY [Candidatus Aminicenantes bacterium]